MTFQGCITSISNVKLDRTVGLSFCEKNKKTENHSPFTPEPEEMEKMKVKEFPI